MRLTYRSQLAYTHPAYVGMPGWLYIIHDRHRPEPQGYTTGASIDIFRASYFKV